MRSNTTRTGQKSDDLSLGDMMNGGTVNGGMVNGIKMIGKMMTRTSISVMMNSETRVGIRRTHMRNNLPQHLEARAPLQDGPGPQRKTPRGLGANRKIPETAEVLGSSGS